MPAGRGLRENHHRIANNASPSRATWWSGELMLGLEEEDIPQPPAEDHSDHAVRQQVVDIAHREPLAQSAPDAQARERDERDEPREIHQPIPADRQAEDADGDGIELRMNEQTGSLAKPWWRAAL